MRAVARLSRHPRRAPGLELRPCSVAASSTWASCFFATEDLGASKRGFSVLVALFGLGFVLGSLSGAQGGTLPELKRAYLLGLAVMGGGLLATGLAPVFGVALATFALAGFGNGVVLVYERLLIQRTVADELTGRVFGIKDSMACWAFALAFLAAGGAISRDRDPHAVDRRRGRGRGGLGAPRPSTLRDALD